MALIGRVNRFRYPITAIAVVGHGALVALAVGLSLYLGLSSAAENTRRLMAQRSETLVNDLDRRITSQLQPVVRQARWAVAQIERGSVKMEDSQALNTFMRFVLGATPHLAEIAITDPRARSRRWTGTSAQPLVKEWSERPDVTAWLEALASLSGPRWRAPLWSATLGTTVLHLDTPIRIDGKFTGVFSQAVTISDLSRHIASLRAETGVIPFILYGRDHVLAHPMLISWTPSVTDRDHPLVALDALGDAVLERIRAPGNRELYLLGGMTEASSSRVTVGEDLYVFLYRDIDQFGPEPWTIGAYVRFGTSDIGKWLADIVRAAMSGSFEDTAGIHGNEFERVVATVLAGVAVLVLSVALGLEHEQAAGARARDECRQVEGPLFGRARLAPEIEVPGDGGVGEAGARVSGGGDDARVLALDGGQRRPVTANAVQEVFGLVRDWCPGIDERPGDAGQEAGGLRRDVDFDDGRRMVVHQGTVERPRGEGVGTAPVWWTGPGAQGAHPEAGLAVVVACGECIVVRSVGVEEQED